MLAWMRGFLSRHRRKLIVGAVLVGSAVLASRYAQKKLRQWQERETKEFLERARRQQHFESTERTCNQTALSLAPTVREAVSRALDTEALVARLREAPAPVDKLPLWERLKVLAFARAAAQVYAGALLVVALRVQLSLIGGYMYRDPRTSGDLQQNYLSLCQHLVREGARELCVLLEEKVRLVVGDTPLARRLDLRDAEQLFWAVQAAVAGDSRDPARSAAHYVLPPGLPGDCASLRALAADTADLLDSDEVAELATSCVSRGFAQLVDRIAEFYTDGAQPRNGLAHPHDASVPMAKLVPIVNGLGQQNPDPWLQQLLLDEKLKLLGANVYEAFSHAL
ncbi:peroxisomal biogenesis factor 3 [Periplaneta americana]|uniref:Peroxisomal biogenesis factor 3 n=1 Tax=Periplaneta americana TaxID=6978 RepID=A0ABQ8U041_PERAM|nr:hypothetical protein ANN_03840 [Periplaneta americana]